jgi:epsilon-lactone hydrolase
MPSPQANELIALYDQYRLAPDVPPRTIGELRMMTTQALDAQAPISGADIAAVDLDGVAAEQTISHDASPDRVVVYFHGGGYVCGSASGQRAFLSALSREAGAEVLSIDYRLAPEHPYPAAVDDGVAAYRVALDRAGDRPISVGGDSAGGGLAVAVVLAVGERGLPMPTAVFALSPWTDLTLEGDALDSYESRDVMVRRADLQMMRACYIGDGIDPHIGTVSPAYGTLSRFPRLLVQVGGEEVLIGDAQLLVERARAAGVEATLEISGGMFHTSQVIAPHLPESQTAIASLGSFLRADALA